MRRGYDTRIVDLINFQRSDQAVSCEDLLSQTECFYRFKINSCMVLRKLNISVV